MKYVNTNNFEQKSRKIDQNIENTLRRVVDDYSHHWQGVLGETIQNSFDAWCTNRFDRKTIFEGQPLKITFEIDLNKREFRAKDNAGGMPKNIFYHKFAGLDTPGDEKQSGGAGGSYGRGFHVISGLGKTTYAETHHDDFRGGIVVKNARQMETDPRLNISTQGTRIEVTDCESDVLVDLCGREMVKEYIQERFQPLLELDGVTIEYIIDGDSQVISPVDLSGFAKLWEGSIEFEFGGDSRTLENVIIYDKTSCDKDVPFEGVQMLKRNEHMDKPFMRVHEYRPRQVRHLDKMFGFCDASTLCPKYENNAHNAFTNSVPSHSGLKDRLEDIEREHFIGTPTDLEERDELVETTISVVNKQWQDNPFDSETEAEESNLEGLAGEVLDNGTNLDDSADDSESGREDDSEESERLLDEIEDEDTDDEPTAIDDVEIEWPEDTQSSEDGDPTATLTVSTRQQRVDTDSEVQVWANIENPEGSEDERFHVTATLETPDKAGAPEDLKSFNIKLAPGEGTSGDHSWMVETSEPGTYIVDASLYPSGDDEKLDSSTVKFIAGDSDENSIENENNSNEGLSGRPVTFLENIKFVRAENEPEFRAELNEGTRGMILIVNSAHPEWKHAVKLDGKSSIREREIILIRWANEAITNRMLLDELEEELGDETNTNGEKLSEQLSTWVRETVINQFSEMVATAHNEVGS